MSNGQSDRSEDDAASRSRRRIVPSARRASAALGAPVRAIGFWSAIALPVVSLPLLVLGLDTRRRAVAFAVLLVANVVALLLGRSYRSE